MSGRRCLHLGNYVNYVYTKNIQKLSKIGFYSKMQPDFDGSAVIASIRKRGTTNN
jgi:hypothetical protein